MAERQKSTVVDWLVIALSPVLVMLMVGSLVYFLIDVLYSGEWTSRLCYTFFFFVIAAVLIARIGIEQGSTKANLYTIGLGVATFIAMSQFVEYPREWHVIGPIINIVLMVIVWWAAKKLTWDCTHLDEERKSSGRGILAAVGLDGPTKTNDAEARAKAKQGETDEEAEKVAREEAKKRKKDPDGMFGWFARWGRHSTAQNKKPHTPGTWIVYFSLAAFPIFGLGQSLIPTDDGDRRRATFQEMAIYVGSGLMLLVTTSLLSLRKYLRERNAKIPAKMTLGWLGLGAGIVVLFLVVGAVLPRPHSETPLINLPKFAKANSDDSRDGKGQEKKASKNAQKTDDNVAGKGDGKEGQKKEASKDGKKSGKSDEKGGNAGEKGDGGGKGDDKGGKNDNKQNDDKSNRDAKRNAEVKKNEEKKQQNGPNGKQDDAGKKADDEQRKDADKGAEKENSDSSGKNDNSENFLQKAFEAIGKFIKWIMWFVIAIAVVVGIFIFFLKYLEPFTQWAKNLLDWLRSLFAPKPKSGKVRANDTEETAEEEEVRPTFADFPNPFDDGTAKRMTLPQLVEYSFAALDAWGWDHNLGRNPNETPNEFAARIGEQCEDLDAPGRRLANLYVRSLYSNADLPATEAMKTLQEFWREIERAELVEA